jgi:hypothetical protein
MAIIASSSGQAKADHAAILNLQALHQPLIVGQLMMMMMMTFTVKRLQRGVSQNLILYKKADQPKA